MLTAHVIVVQRLSEILLWNHEYWKLDCLDMLGIIKIILFRFRRWTFALRVRSVNRVLAGAFLEFIGPFPSELGDFPTLFVFSNYHFGSRIIYSKSGMSKLNR